MSSTLAPTEVPRPAPAPPPAGIDRRHGAVAGAAAAGGALAAGEVVVEALAPGPSLITAVGSEFIDRFAAPLKDLAVALFGTNDKIALVVGIVVVSIALGAVLGAVAGGRTPIVASGLAVFGAAGAWALATDPQGSVAVGVIGGVAAAAAGSAVYLLLTRLAVRSRVPADAPDAAAPTVPARTVLARRAFLIGTGSVIVSSAALAVFSRHLAGRSGVATARRTTRIPRPVRSTPPPPTQPFTVVGLTPYVTANDDFYRIDTALSSPQVDVGSWRLDLTGMVGRPYALSYDELLALDAVEETVTICCVSNEVGGRLIGNAVWQGVSLADLLERADVDPAAAQVIGRSVDGWTAGFPTAEALDGRTALVAYAMNGEPLPVDHGYPARLIVAGLYGYVSATKWLREIELTTLDVDGYWVPRGWAKDGPIRTQCRIDVPGAGGGVLPAGTTAIAGVAWAPHRGIAGVEVRVDDGPWLPAELGRVASADTWVQWHVAWEATPGDHTIVARATDGTGDVQTSERAAPAPSGATGYPSRRVRVA